MKNIRFAFSLVLGSMIFGSCQDSGVSPYSRNATDQAISTRGDECDNCNSCCCFVELYNDNAAQLRICGTQSGGLACSTDPGDCGQQIDGLTELIALSSSNPKFAFCMVEFTAMRIVNTALSDNAVIRVGCNTASFDPIEFNIAAQDSAKADVILDCEVVDCDS